MTKEEIKKILSANREILMKYKVKSIAVFGSYVRNEQTEDSDIDLLVEFELSAFDSYYNGYFDNYIKLLSSLEEIFGRKTDLLTIEMISPYIKPYVLREVEYLETA
ncbi:nucleotidyltransferase family protein [Candidatus Poribacteria bacterium]|nr:nucleotidyltransferase family protein [Candidatus Poribacteria bacterium]